MPSVLGWQVTPMMIIQRLWRCNNDDVAVLKKIKAFYAGTLAPKLIGAFTGYSSLCLLWNVYVGESQSPIQQPTPTFLTNSGLSLDRNAFATFFPEVNVSVPFSLFPKYVDPLSGKYPVSFSKPLLLLNGGLDGNTPISYAFHAYQKYVNLYSGGASTAPKLLIYPPGKHVLGTEIPQARLAILKFMLNPSDETLKFTSDNYVFKGLGQVSDVFSDPKKYSVPADMFYALTTEQFNTYKQVLAGNVSMTPEAVRALVWSTDKPLPSLTAAPAPTTSSPQCAPGKSLTTGAAVGLLFGGLCGVALLMVAQQKLLINAHAAEPSKPMTPNPMQSELSNYSNREL